MVTLDQELFEKIQNLDTQQKEQVLAFVRDLTQPIGEPFGDIVRHAQELNISREDLEEMKKFIASECE